MNAETQAGRVIVLGSANVDAVTYVDAFPQPGETVLARDARTGLGGKGANQAVAASLMGADVSFAGAVGDDASGEFVRRTLERHGVGVTALSQLPGILTGSAAIAVDAAGENTIIVASGANARLDPAWVRSEAVVALFAGARSAATVSSTVPSTVLSTVSPTVSSADSSPVPSTDSSPVSSPVSSTVPSTALSPVRSTVPSTVPSTVVGLAQGELPAAVVAEFTALCAERGARFVLNLAPVIEVDQEVLAHADPLVVNELEAFAVLGEPASADIHAAAGILLAQKLAETSRSVVITLGAAGAVLVTAGGATQHVPSPMPERVVDTTGAGDAFVGALVARLARGDDLGTAVRWGVSAGSAAVQLPGASDSYAGLGTLTLAHQ